jgi:hypothetical protein
MQPQVLTSPNRCVEERLSSHLYDARFRSGKQQADISAYTTPEQSRLLPPLQTMATPIDMKMIPNNFLGPTLIPDSIHENAIVNTGSVDITICARLALTAAWDMHIERVPA